MRPIAALVMLALVIYPTRANADSPVHLEIGAPAPYPGLLLEHGHAAALLKAEPRRARAHAEVRGLKARLLRTEADLTAERQARQVDQEEARAHNEAHDAALLRCEQSARTLAEPPPWYERPAFVVPTTTAVTLILGGLVVYLVR